MFSMEAAISPGGDTEVMLYVILSLIGLCLQLGAYGKLYNGTLAWLRKRTGGRLGNSTYPPNRTQVIVGMAWGGVFTLLGLLVLIPVTGGFGIFWTLVGAMFTLLQGWQYLKKYPASGRDQSTARRLEQLEKRVQAHNNLIERMYQVEERTELQEEKIKAANRRIENLERRADAS